MAKQSLKNKMAAASVLMESNVISMSELDIDSYWIVNSEELVERVNETTKGSSFYILSFNECDENGTAVDDGKNVSVFANVGILDRQKSNCKIETTPYFFQFQGLGKTKTGNKFFKFIIAPIEDETVSKPKAKPKVDKSDDIDSEDEVVKKPTKKATNFLRSLRRVRKMIVIAMMSIVWSRLSSFI